MVERLKAAIEKARRMRESEAAAGQTAARVGSGPATAGPELAVALTATPEITLDPRRLERMRIVTTRRVDPACRAFDVLRTRLLKLCREQGWRRIMVTSPTRACGKSTVVMNLAMSLARQPETRTLVMDLDLKIPRIAQILGVTEQRRMVDLLSGATPPEDFLMRVGANLFLGVNSQSVSASAELVQGSSTPKALDAVMRYVEPTIMLVDSPPMLVSDDVMALLPHVDGVLLVAAAGASKTKQIAECERLFAPATNFIGVILNKSEEGDTEIYGYNAE